MVMKQTHIFRAKCKEAKLRITPQRVLIYESLANDKSHPSTDIVFRRVREKNPNISLDTVNRTLLSFVDMGILKIVGCYGRSKRFDPDIGNHHHFQCLKCGKIVDFYNKKFDILELPKDIKNKFTVTGKKVFLEGICNYCRK